MSTSISNNSNIAFKSRIIPDKNLAELGTEFATGVAQAAKTLAKDGKNDEFVIVNDEYRHFNKHHNGIGGFYTRAQGILLFKKEPKLTLFGKTILSKPLRKISKTMNHEQEIKAFNPINMKVLFKTGTITSFDILNSMGTICSHGIINSEKFEFTKESVTNAIVNGAKNIRETIKKDKQLKLEEKAAKSKEMQKTNSHFEALEMPETNEETRKGYLGKMGQAQLEIAKQNQIEAEKALDKRNAAKILDDIRKG